MKRSAFRQLCVRRPVILDGATGTELARRGLPRGACPERWALENPAVLAAIQREYARVGSDFVYTCTFGANPFKLAEYGLGEQTELINREHARLTREAARGAHVLGALAPTGRFVEPFGDLPFEEAVAAFRRQIDGLRAGGVDGFVIETMMDLQEARAALLAVREACDLPALVSLTFGEDGRTLTGNDPASAIVTLQALGADAVGCNCSTGPAAMLPVIAEMRRLAAVPLLVKPNAGVPRLRDGETVFDLGPEEFAAFGPQFLDAGATLLGGCCGTGPAHIVALQRALGRRRPLPLNPDPPAAVCSSRRAVVFGPGQPLAVIGERINPTGKKALQAELREGRFDLVRQFAEEQVRHGAALLDLNCGLSGIDEAATLRSIVSLLSPAVDAPLCIDTTDPDALAAALRLCPGRALVNSISAEAKRLDRLLPVAARYGAMLIVLPVTDAGVPTTATERAAVTRKIYARAKRHGYRLRDLVVDGLVMAASADPAAPAETLATVEWAARTFGAATVLGVSNVSFGMPERKWLNAAFLAMAVDRGLTMAIANPSAEMTMEMRAAAAALCGRDPGFRDYLGRFAAPAAEARGETPGERLFDAILRGDRTKAAAEAEAALAAGVPAQQIVDRHLLPAIARVGDLFDRRQYFLPQLMLGAEAMRAAFERIEPRLGAASAGGPLARGETVVLATVRGDIHDIGKNLVALMLRNYGFRVVDLGKDVSTETLLAAVRRERAAVLGLSALMTTTMGGMQEAVARLRAEKLPCRVMIGGAVVDAAYAAAIGADGYAPDAVGAVRLARELAGGGGRVDPRG